MNRSAQTSRAVPKQALLLSLLSLWVPVVSSTAFPDWAISDVGVLVWLLALVPGFLLSYYKGWKGASLALAGGMAALSVTQVGVAWSGRAPPPTAFLFGIVVVLTTVSLASGFLSTLFHRALERAQRLALTDSGTGLANRRHGILELEKAFAAARRGSALTVVLFDLDNFKRTNDAHGHTVGDRVLVEFAEVLSAATRSMHVASRYGGEEFLAVLRDTEAEGARVYAERVLEWTRGIKLPSGMITVSAGVAQYEPGMLSPEVLVATADQALYRAKAGGRNRVVVLGGQEQDEPTPDVVREDQADERRALEGHGELILVVDDDVDSLRSVARALRRLGYVVLESPSPKNAVEIARGLDEPLDLVLTDIVMPEMGGFRLIEMIEETQEGVSAIYMSGYSQEEVDWGGVPGAAYDYLSKPISVKTLAQRVQKLLDKDHKSRKPRAAPTRLAVLAPARRLERHQGNGVPGGWVGGDATTLVWHSDPAEGERVAALFRRRGLGDVQVASEESAMVDRLPHARLGLVVVDLQLPDPVVRECLDLVRRPQASAPALLLLVAEGERHVLGEVTDLRGVDFVSVPCLDAELELRARSLLRARSYEVWIASAEEWIGSRIAARTAELEEAREEVLRRLAWAAEYRDDLTGHHAERVGLVSGLIARELGWSASRRAVVEKAAPLHDLGKIAIPDSILRKPGVLTSAEREVMERHTTIGAEILAGSRNPILQAAEKIALTHHERWDGKGYPGRLAGDEIPSVGRIVAVADAFDSMTNDRPYRSGTDRVNALATIEEDRGSHFDPEVVGALLHLADQGELEPRSYLTLVGHPDRS